MNNHKIAQMYGNAGYRFPRTTQEAFGPGACVFVATDDEPVESSSFATFFAVVIYTLAAVVIGFILWW